jgi:(2Fe-2S) ferredoxin
MVERIASIEALKAIKQEVAAIQAGFRLRLMICGSNDCHLTGSDNVKSALDSALQETGLTDQVQIVETGCIGSCSMGPVMTVLPQEIFYMKLKAEDVPELVESHLVKGVPVQRLMYHDPATGKAVPRRPDIPFFALQQSFVLHNKGLIDPKRIEDYIWRDGYQAMFKSLTGLKPSEIIAEIKASGLRGRGGGGFPTGLKWEFCASTKSDVKYVLCNADEGDPGAFMDRRIMEDDPHAILEGMGIGAKAIDAHQGYIYCRAEYPLAIERLNRAIAQAEERGLLGMFSSTAVSRGMLAGGILGTIWSAGVSFGIPGMALHYYAVVNFLGTWLMCFAAGWMDRKLTGTGPSDQQLAWTGSAARAPSRCMIQWMRSGRFWPEACRYRPCWRQAFRPLSVTSPIKPLWG